MGDFKRFFNVHVVDGHLINSHAPAFCSSETSCSRVFKSIMGVTPAEFRSVSAEEKNSAPSTLRISAAD